MAMFAFPVEAGLARALAEAATGFPNSGDIYFVASYTRVPADQGSPYDVNGPFTDELTALAKAAELDVVEWLNGQKFSYGVFGPFSTVVPELITVPGQPQVGTITVTEAGTTSDGFTIDDASKYDSMFYSAAAVEKFAVPYYSRVYGSAVGQEVLRNFQQPDVMVMVHMPWTEYAELTDTGNVAERVLLFTKDGSQRDGITGH